MWTIRGVAAASVLILAACGGPEPRGQLSFTPRPELTAPPGEMSAQRLVLMKGTTGDNKGKSMGSISIAPDGPGILLRIDLRNLPAGTQLMTFNEDADCSAEEIDGKVVPAAGAGMPWGPDNTPIKLPSLEPTPEGQVKLEHLVRGLSVPDTRDRAIVITQGGVRIGCGVAQ